MCRRPAWASVPANPLADAPCPAGEPRLLLLPVTAHFPVTGILAKPNPVWGGQRPPALGGEQHAFTPWVRGAPCDDRVLHVLSPWVRAAPCDDRVLHGTRSHCRTQRVPGAWPCSCLAKLFLLEPLCLRLCPGILGPSVPGQQQDRSDLVPSPGQLCCPSLALPAWGVTLPLPTHWFTHRCSSSPVLVTQTLSSVPTGSFGRTHRPCTAPSTAESAVPDAAAPLWLEPTSAWWQPGLWASPTHPLSPPEHVLFPSQGPWSLEPLQPLVWPGCRPGCRSLGSGREKVERVPHLAGSRSAAQGVNRKQKPGREYPHTRPGSGVSARGLWTQGGARSSPRCGARHPLCPPAGGQNDPHVPQPSLLSSVETHTSLQPCVQVPAPGPQGWVQVPAPGPLGWVQGTPSVSWRPSRARGSAAVVCLSER